MSLQCDLLLTLCESLLNVPNPGRVLETEAPSAFSLAEAIGDSRRASRACYVSIWALTNSGGPAVLAGPEAAKWAERYDRYARPDTADRVWAAIYLGVKYFTSHPSEGVALLSRGLDLACRLGDSETLWWAASMWLSFVMAPQHAEERLRLAEELAEASRDGVSNRVVSTGLTALWHAFLESEQRQRAGDKISEVRDIAGRTRLPDLQLRSMQIDATLAALDGRLEEAVEICQRLIGRGNEQGMLQNALLIVGHAGLWPLLHLGKVNEALESVTHFPFPPFLQARAVCLAYLGQNAEVGEILERQVLNRLGIGTADDEFSSYNDILSLAAAVLVGNHKAAELLLNRFAGIKVYTSGIYFTTCVPRHLGGAAALLSKYEDTRQHYREAIRVCTEMRFRPELALTRLQLAELLLEHCQDEKKEALVPRLRHQRVPRDEDAAVPGASSEAEENTEGIITLQAHRFNFFNSSE